MASMLEERFDLPQIGQVCWICVRPARREPVLVVDVVEARVGSGLVGDRYRGSAGGREVTLIQAEHVEQLHRLLGRATAVDPALLRRNILVSGINLLGLQGRVFQIGDAVLEATGLADPCARMEEVLGAGGFQAMRGHGGITARVLRNGLIRLRDPVQLVVTTGKDAAQPVVDGPGSLG